MDRFFPAWSGDLFEVHLLTVPPTEEKLKLTCPGAKRNVMKLVEADILA